MGFFGSSSWRSKETKQPTIARCGHCGLFKDCYSPKMSLTGKGKHKILFVAEAPGEQEDRLGTQLIGDSGKLFRRMLKGVGVDLEDCWKTNAVICRPPKNKMDSRYIQSCRPNLFNVIKELQPKVIIPLGKSAVSSLIGPVWKKDVGAITRWVGWTIPLREHGAWVCPTYHPAYLLRMDEDPLLKLLMEQHLERALELERKEIETIPLEELRGQVEVILKDRPAKARLKDLLGKKGELAFDYETTGLKPEKEEQRIVSCSFCFEGEDTFAFKVTDGVRRLLSKVLQSSDLGKIASNMKFEERWTRTKLGHPVANWSWDTMLAAHVLDNRKGITSIKFQAFIHLGIGDYNSHIEGYLRSETSNGLNRIDDIDDGDLLLYNGLDATLEYLVAEKQRKLLG